MKVGVMTSSRADYSIYYPLLKKLNGDPFFELHILAFGTHLSTQHGRTVEIIKEDGFTVSYQFDTLPLDDSPQSIVKAQAKTIKGVKKVKGHGLMLGLEFDFEVGELRKKLIYEHRIFTGGSSNKKLLRILPPLTIQQKHFDQFFDALKQSL